VTIPVDFYGVLGLTRGATTDEMKKAYRRLAREYHPDANPGDDAAAEHFKEISVAYATLSDPEKRRQYDMFGAEGLRAGTGGAAGADFGLNDLFEAFFGGDPFAGRGASGPPRGPDAEATVALTLEEVLVGSVATLDVRLPVTCAACDGSGCESGTHPQSCPTCAGTGEVREVRRSILGQVMTSAPCPQCGADGRVIPNPCPDCRGEGRIEGPRTIEVDVPKGIADGQRLRLAGRGPAARRGGSAGDLYVTVRVRPHERFERHGDDLYRRVDLPLTQAVLGAQLEVETLDGMIEVAIRPGTQAGAVHRARGRGLPDLRSGRRGDVVLEVAIEIPTRLDATQTELFERLAELRDETTAPIDQGFFSRIRSAFPQR